MAEKGERSKKSKTTFLKESGTELLAAYTEGPDFRARLETILREAVDALAGSAGIVALWNEKELRFVEGATYGLDSKGVARLRPLLTQAIPDLAESDLSFNQISCIAPILNTTAVAVEVTHDPIIALPLKIEGKSVGLIYVVRPCAAESFTSNDQQALSFFADQAAISVQNVRLLSQLAEERFKIESILESSADGIMIIDPERHIVRFNAGAERISGWSKEEAIGSHCFEVLRMRDIYGKNLCQNRCPIVKNIEGFASFAATLITKQGQDVDIDLSYSVARSPDGGLLATMVNIHDIRHLREIENLRSALLAAVSHELQTPIAIIKAYAHTLARPDAEWGRETIISKLHAIEEESDHLSDLVGKLLYTSRIEGGDVSLNRLLLDLGIEARRVAKRFAEVREDCRVQVDFSPDVPPVFADPEKIDEVLTNLVDNAMKFSPAGGTITISGEVQDGNVLVVIADEGVGIPISDQERIFERFYRVEDVPAIQVRGAGLGLYICQTLIEAHGGRIWVESEPNSGSRFVFSLPTATENRGYDGDRQQ